MARALSLLLALSGANAWQAVQPLRLHATPRIARTAAPPTMDFGFQRPIKEDAAPGEVADVPFEVRFSIGNVVTASGAFLFVYCLGTYLLNNGQTDFISTLGFVYAIPALVGGLALKYAELPPVPLKTSPAAEKARESKATTIQAKILSDATRFTYGDAHMEDPLKALKLAPRGMGPPELKGLGEELTESGEYMLKMRFYAPNTPYRVWKDRAPRYSRFFGPGVRAQLKLIDADRRLVELQLITVSEGDDDAPLEVLADGTLQPVKTAAEEEEAAAEATASRTV